MTTQQERCPAHIEPADQPAMWSRPLRTLPRTVVALAVAGAVVGVLELLWHLPTSPALVAAATLSLAILFLAARFCVRLGAVKVGEVLLREDRRRRGKARRPGRTASPPPARIPTTPVDPVGQHNPERSLERTDVEAVRAAAEEFLALFHAENPQVGPMAPRLAAVRREIDLTGTYWHTPEELAFGARVAWRNNARCIGRLYWQSLQVRDLRTVSDAGGLAEHCFEHLREAHNGGRIRPTISVFAPETPSRPAPRIWNEQLIRYAGYEQPDGGVLGDPRYRGFTSKLIQRGWRPPASRGAFDVLPLVVETVEEGPRMFELPGDALHEVQLEHPELAWFADLGMRWHAVPVISNSRLVIGGVSYPAAPFSGWYMGTEIGARNLGDSDRYDLVPEVAKHMGLDTSDEATLWRDQALVEINRAVLHSFRVSGVTISDHHTESRRFLTHLEREERAGRRCPADWSWIVPPMSGSQTPVFHRYYDTEDQVPNFFTDDEATGRALQGGPPAFR